VVGDEDFFGRPPLGRGGYGTEGPIDFPTIEGRAILKLDMISSQLSLLMLCSWSTTCRLLREEAIAEISHAIVSLAKRDQSNLIR